FFDRRYDSNSQLIKRSEKDSLLIDPNEAISQIKNLIDFEELKKNKKKLYLQMVKMKIHLKQP
ncbi:MAG: LamB/YcsF family protein, partial [Paracoccaceae bacterium]|nr:LamB/YcsF family protein [Paracoccaceae bacterium]